MKGGICKEGNQLQTFIFLAPNGKKLLEINNISPEVYKETRSQGESSSRKHESFLPAICKENASVQ